VGLSGASPAWKRPRESNGVGVTPAMGFNNWNSGLPSSAATALTAANAFVSLGLKAVGYEYINTDDTWSNMSRVNGLLSPDNTKWPNGIAAVATEIHGLGLKMGLYGDSGTTTCSGFPGSEGYETTDANTLAGWGIDFWKYDNVCFQSLISLPLLSFRDLGWKRAVVNIKKTVRCPLRQLLSALHNHEQRSQSFRPRDLLRNVQLGRRFRLGMGFLRRQFLAHHLRRER